MSDTRPRSERAAWAAVGLTCAGLIFSAGIWYGSSKTFSDKLAEIVQKVDGLTQKVDDLPADRTELHNQAGEIAGLQQKFDTLDGRVGTAEGKIIGLRSDLDNIIRASNAPIMPGRGR